MGKKTIRVAEEFSGIQGEGKYAGYPAYFIRVSGCNLSCSYCDSKYHKDGKEKSIKAIVEHILASGKKIVIFTGGEPLLYKDQISEVIKSMIKKERYDIDFHVETNGILLNEDTMKMFDYIACSPKSSDVAKKVSQLRKKEWAEYYNEEEFDIKVVVNMGDKEDTLGLDMIKYATCLMPFSSGNLEKDLEGSKIIWEYCNIHNIKFSPRLQTYLFALSTRAK